MKITGAQVGPVNQIYTAKVKKADDASAVRASRATDSVELSADANAIAAARKALADVPDVRDERIEALRREIEAGNYHVSADDIAQKILAEMRLSKLAQK